MHESQRETYRKKTTHTQTHSFKTTVQESKMSGREKKVTFRRSDLV